MKVGVTLAAALGLLCVVGNLFAQETVWIKTYGGPTQDVCHTVKATSDGGYVILGSTETSSPSDWDMQIIKVDSIGDTLWTRTYDVWGTDIEPTLGGGFVVCGSGSSPAGDDEVLVMRFDSLGDTLWTRKLGGDGNQQGTDVAVNKDGSVVICGSTSVPPSSLDAYVIKVDQFGSEIWSSTLGEVDGPDNANAIKPLFGIGYIVTGSAGSTPFLALLDVNGEVTWRRSYGAENVGANDVAVCRDGGFVACGTKHSVEFPWYVPYVIKVNADGDSIWAHSHDVLFGRLYEIGPLDDGNFLAYGKAGEYIWGCGLLIKIDSHGGILWENCHQVEHNRNTWGVSMEIAGLSHDSGIVLAGIYYNGECCNPDSADLYVVKKKDTTYTASVSGQSCISPNPMFVFFANSIDTMYATVYLGDFTAGYSVTDIDPVTMRLNGTLMPTSWTILYFYPGFTGKVMRITFPIADFIRGHGTLWNTTIQEYTVSGQFNDSIAFLVSGEVTMIGHTSGDVNGDGRVNVADLTYLIDFLFNGGPEPPVMETADIDNSGAVNVADVTELVRFLFG